MIISNTTFEFDNKQDMEDVYRHYMRLYTSQEQFIVMNKKAIVSRLEVEYGDSMKLHVELVIR
jgi:hypothetical protein